MSVFTALLTTLRDCGRSRVSLQLEILALRHQLHVLERSQGRRLRLTHFDRLLWVWFFRAWSQWRSALVIVKPDTVIRWHQRGVRLFRTWKSRHGTGRPTLPQEVRTLIRTMSTANPLWGAPRIHGELLKLGFTVSQATRRQIHGSPLTTPLADLANVPGQPCPTTDCG
jgi:putative transposase